MHCKSPSRVIVAIILLTIFLVACDNLFQPVPPPSKATSQPGELDPNKKYTITFWDAFADGAGKSAVDTLTALYMSQHPNVTVRVESSASYDDLSAKIEDTVRSGNRGAVPALAQMYEQKANVYQQSGIITSLKPFLDREQNGQEDLNDFYPALIADGKINAEQYMLPFNKSVIVLYYNSDVLRKVGITPPATLQELESDLAEVTKPDGSQWGLSYSPDVDLWSILYEAQGGGYFTSDDGKKAVFAEGQNAGYAKGALQELRPLVQSGAVHLTDGKGWQSDFISQKSVFALVSTANYPALDSAIHNSSNPFQFTEIPIPAGKVGHSTTVLFGTNLVMFSQADTDTKAAAWDYMKFLTNSQANSDFVQMTGYIPTRISAYDSSALQSYYARTPARKAELQSLPFAFVASSVPAWEQCRNYISTSFTDTLSGKKTTDDAFNAMSTRCQKDLAKQVAA